MDETEKTIWKYLYYIRYYNKLMLDNLGAAGIQDVIEYQSDGGRIKRYNKNEIAKSYLSLKQGAEDTLKDLLVAYNSCVPSAMSIQGEDAFYQGGCVVNNIIDSCRRC